METLTVVIVNWNTGDLLAQCLHSLLALPEKEQTLLRKVVVVDNNSRDDSVTRARRAAGSDSRVQFTVLPQNSGFAHANNIVLSQAGSDSHVLLLNPDTRVLPGAIQEMMAALVREPGAGVVGPNLLNADFTVQPSVRNFPTWGVLVFFLLKLHRLFPRATFWRRYLQADFDYTQEARVDQVMGAAFLIRRQTLEQVGFLDEGFWIWFEEVDYCRRVHRKGWSVLYTPRAQVIHVGGVSFGQWKSLRRYLQFIRSAARYARKYLL